MRSRFSQNNMTQAFRCLMRNPASACSVFLKSHYRTSGPCGNGCFCIFQCLFHLTLFTRTMSCGGIGPFVLCFFNNAPTQPSTGMKEHMNLVWEQFFQES